jgi:hypothetical protein
VRVGPHPARVSALQGCPSVDTLTFYNGPPKVAEAHLRAKLAAVCAANPWLGTYVPWRCDVHWTRILVPGTARSRDTATAPSQGRPRTGVRGR